jgi:effector-binding domain-containing protein
MYDVTLTHETGRHLAVVRYDARPEDMGRKAGEAFGTVAAYLARIGVPVAGPAVSCYDMADYAGAGDVFHVASGFVVEGPFEPGEGVEPIQLPEREVVTTTHIGPYEELGKAYDALKQGAAGQGRQAEEAGLMWEEYWSGPEVPPAETRTVVFWPVTAPAG